MNNTMTADRIASLFAERLPAEGGRISTKQANWLLSVAFREARAPRGREINGYLTDGREWVCTQTWNGSGMLRLISVEEQALRRAAVVREQALKALNTEYGERLAQASLAGDAEALKAIGFEYAQKVQAVCQAPAAELLGGEADGSDDYTGEDDLTERAIENANDAWASMQTALDEGWGR